MIGGATGSLFLPCIAFLVVLTVVVFIHEFGHFWVGRLCGVGVTAFSIGFGPGTRRLERPARHALEDLGDPARRLCEVRRRHQRRQRAGPETSSTQMTPAERAVSFPHQSVAKRAAIVAAGPIANFILAIVIFAGINYFNGRQVLEPRIEAVQPGSAAERAGFQPNDLIVDRSTGGAIESFADMQRIVSASAGEALAFVVDRGGADRDLERRPRTSASGRRPSASSGSAFSGVRGLPGPGGDQAR